MTQTVLWGTGLNGGTVQRRRITSDFHRRVTSDGDQRVCTVQVSEVFFFRKTSAGDRRITSEGDRRQIATGPLGPQYFATADVTTDGGEPFSFLYVTDPWQPSAQGGENVFAWAHVTLSWSMSGIVRVWGYTDGSSATVTLADGSTVVPVMSTFQLAQQGGSLQRVSQIFSVPLSRIMRRAGVEVTRFYQRGERLQLAIESTGQLGIGELMIEGIEVEYEPVRKAAYATVQSEAL